MSETELKAQVMATLQAVGVHAIRVQSGTVKVRGGWMQLAPNGTGDILVFPRMKLPVWLETKTLDGKQREAQKEFEEMVRSLGHGYWVIRSLDDLEPLLRDMR